METTCERPKTLEKCRFDFMERGKFFLFFFSRLRGFFIVLTCIKYISLKDYALDVFKSITYKFCLLTLFF